jgi:isorenieratene synthase
MPFPTALMERAAASAALATNAVLDRYGSRRGPVWSVPPRGIFAGRAPRPTGDLADAGSMP